MAFAGRPLSARLMDAMIRQSPAVDAGGLPADDLPDRVSPFDLALYRSWADENPGLDAAQVERGSDAYVEGRIIERLGDQLVLRTLPVLAPAGRCRVATIAAFTGTDAAALGPRLAEQEWIHADGDPPTHVAASPALARRLQHYFSAPERVASFTAETTRLAEMLRREVHDRPLADIDVDELLTALRLSEPADAVDLWDYIAEGITAAGRWSWALNVTRRVLGELQDERWLTAEALRATVLVSFIAASRRASWLWDPRGAWAEVRTWSDRHPDPGTARVLRARAALGLLPYAPDDESLWTDLRAAGPSTVLAASATDAAHRMLEAGAGQAVARLIDEEQLRAALNGAAGSQGRVWARVAVARRAADEDPRGSFEALGQAEAEAVSAGRSQEPSWPDLVLPDDLLARVCIERGLIATPEAAVLESWEFYAAAALGTIDGERLASLCLRLRLWQAVVEPSAIERWDELDRYEPDRVAICTAHDLVPPLCVMRAEAWLAAGSPERALALIDERRSQALRTRSDDTTVRFADAETIRIVRRMRLNDHRALLSRIARPRDTDPARLDLRDNARRAMALVHCEPPTDALSDIADQPASWHAWWQSQLGNPTASWLPMWSSEMTSTELADDIELDLEEARQLSNPGLEDTRQRLDDWLTRPRPSRRPVHSADPGRDVRAALRREALTDAFYVPRPEVPVRLLAELAFEEAELLALRLPAAARPLFERAAGAYAASGDPIGELMATASAAAISGSPGGEVATTQLSAVLARNPAAGAALAGSPDAAGPWRFWAQLLRNPSGPGEPQVPSRSVLSTATAAPIPAMPREWGPPRSRPRSSRRRTRVVALTAVLLAGVAAGAMGIALSSLHPSPDRAKQSTSATAGTSTLHSPSTLGGSSPSTVGSGQVHSSPPQASTSAPETTPVTQSSSPTLGSSGTPHPASAPEPFVRLPTVLVIGLVLVGVLSVSAVALVIRRGKSYRRSRSKPSAREGAGWPGSSEPSVEAVISYDRRSSTGRVTLTIGGSVTSDQRLVYRGTFPDAESADRPEVTWTVDSPPASASWWDRAVRDVPGRIQIADELFRTAQPWERILNESLRSPEADLIEWTRYVRRAIEPFPANSSTAVVLDAADEWRRYLADVYQSPPPQPGKADSSAVRVRHVIGRALTTSAGPQVDVGGSAGLSDRKRESVSPQGPVRRDTEYLTRGQPSLVVLQAEPSENLTRSVPGMLDDQPEKLALAADLMEAGTPAVLILPVLPGDRLEAIAEIIYQHVNSRQAEDAQVIHHELRKTLGGVGKDVLGDVVLFVNVKRYAP